MAYDATFTKDPDEVLDFTRDWSPFLGTDTIASSAFVVPTGLTKGLETNDTTTATVWLSGGTNHAVYIVTNRITTAAGRTADRSWLITIGER